MRPIFPLIFSLFLSTILSAQPEFGLSLMRHTFQASTINPAHLPKEKLVIALPNFSNHLQFSGPSIGDLVLENEQGEVQFNVDGVLDKLEDQNTLRDHLGIETIGIAFGGGPLKIGVSHRVRFDAYMKYPKNLAQLIWQGNAQFIGQTIDIGNEFQVTGLNEFALGAAWNLKAVTLGAKVKLLTGIGDVSTERNTATLFTSDDVYQLTLQADYLANTSSYFEYQGIQNTRAEIDFGRFQFDQLFSKNTGLAFDFGLNVELGKLNLAASVLDIGKITWTEQVRNYESKGTFVYEGLDFSNAIAGDSITFSQALDTLEQIFMVNESSREYSTELPVKIYLSGVYQLSDKWLLGATFFNEKIRGNSFSGFSIGAQMGLFNWLTVGANYGLYGDAYVNIGLNTTVKLGPVQLLAASDNVLAVLNPDNANFSNARVGLNLVF